MVAITPHLRYDFARENPRPGPGGSRHVIFQSAKLGDLPRILKELEWSERLVTEARRRDGSSG